MKKSDKSFSIQIGSVVTEVGTRSGVANFVRELLGNAEAGKDIDITIKVKEVVTAATPTAE